MLQWPSDNYNKATPTASPLIKDSLTGFAVELDEFVQRREDLPCRDVDRVTIVHFPYKEMSDDQLVFGGIMIKD